MPNFDRLFFLLVGTGLIPHFLLNTLQKKNSLNQVNWKSKNAIVLLGVGTVKWPETGTLSSNSFAFSRLHEAARLYFNCVKDKKVCKLYLSGENPNKNGTSEAEVMQKELMDIGIPKSDTILETKSHNTFQHAQFTSLLLHTASYNSTVIVTSGVHLRRYLLYFSHFGIIAEGAPSDRFEAIISFLPISHNFTFTDIAIHEHMGYIRYFIYNLFGWNIKATQKGAL